MRERCATCGFDPATVSPSDAVVALRTFPRRWRAALALPDDQPDDILRRRPQPDVWSALEYAAHTRDVVAVNGWAMAKALTEDHPALEWPDGGGEEIVSSYATLDPIAVLDELAANCERVADRADRTDAGDWRRPATLRGARDEDVDALWFLHHSVHEGSHHLKDAQRSLQAALRARSG